MESYFDSQDRQDALRAEVHSWIGTPFRARSRAKGAGVDCVVFPAEVLRVCGVASSYQLPVGYSMDWAKHQDRSLVLEWMDACPHVARLPEGECPRLGDVACFRFGRAVHHAGIVLDAPEFVHAIEGRAVQISRLDDWTWQQRIDSFYRPLPHA